MVMNVSSERWVRNKTLAQTASNEKRQHKVETCTTLCFRRCWQGWRSACFFTATETVSLIEIAFYDCFGTRVRFRPRWSMRIASVNGSSSRRGQTGSDEHGATRMSHHGTRELQNVLQAK